MTGKALLKLPEVAVVLRVSVMTVRRLIRRRQLAVVKIGNQLMVRTTELERHIERNTLHAVGEQ
ncbi:MAG TPA: helix-turn-helix domain-containing protein [Chthoniobacterales bacterium]|jgi:excisionase family DNA binding protein